MATFDKNSEAVLSQAQELATVARKAGLSATNLQNSASASFRFEEGDVLTVPAQLAHIVPLTGSALANAKANNGAEAYFAFDASVRRGNKDIPCSVSAKQWFTPTVWQNAEPLDGLDLTDDSGNPIEVFHAPFGDAEKRFGENGIPATIEGIPYLDKETKVKLTLTDVFVPFFLESEQRDALPEKHTALRKRPNYAVAR